MFGYRSYNSVWKIWRIISGIFTIVLHLLLKANVAFFRIGEQTLHFLRDDSIA